MSRDYNEGMQVILNVLLALSIAVATPGATATEQRTTTDTKPPATKILTLSGCVSADPSGPGAFTLSDTKPGTSYRLTGLDVREYAGQRVQVSGVTSRRLRIVGGLYPSPNVAAQAGAIDPAQAAVAAASGPGAASKTLPEFRVKGVQAIPGACPQR